MPVGVATRCIGDDGLEGLQKTPVFFGLTDEGLALEASGVFHSQQEMTGMGGEETFDLV